METYTERDLKLAEDIGGIKALITMTHDKIDDYCKKNEEHHNALWRKVDKHSKFINWLSGVIAIVWLALGLAIDGFRKKMGV